MRIACCICGEIADPAGSVASGGREVGASGLSDPPVLVGSRSHRDLNSIVGVQGHVLTREHFSIEDELLSPSGIRTSGRRIGRIRSRCQWDALGLADG